MFSRILADPDFRDELSLIAATSGLTTRQINRAARRYLQEITARPTPVVVGLAGRVSRLLIRRNYRDIRHRPAELARLDELSAKYPLVILPSHKSQLDHLVMHYLMWLHGRPPNYTAGGANMNLPVLGPILRRFGCFFIRRRIGAHPLYKLVLRTYIAHLLVERRPLEWFIEGTRSRTGRLGAPSFGLLGYAFEALAAGRCQEVCVVPVAIVYDHTEEIESYVTEQRGVPKRRESWAWLVKTILTIGKSYGYVHVRFGTPFFLAALPKGTDRRTQVSRSGKAICAEINRVTPVTTPALVLATLLGAGIEGRSMTELKRGVQELAKDAEQRKLPRADDLSSSLDHGGVGQAVNRLVSRGIVPAVEEEAGYRLVIQPGQRLAGSFYTNTIAHHYLVPAVAELTVAVQDQASRRRPPGEFDDWLGTLHSLLQAEFFLPDQARFARDVVRYLNERSPSWRSRLERRNLGPVLAGLRPYRAPWALVPFLSAQWVVAQAMAEQVTDVPSILRQAVTLADSQVIPPEAVSMPLIESSVRLIKEQDIHEMVDQLKCLLNAGRSLTPSP